MSYSAKFASTFYGPFRCSVYSTSTLYHLYMSVESGICCVLCVSTEMQRSQLQHLVIVGATSSLLAPEVSPSEQWYDYLYSLMSESDNLIHTHTLSLCVCVCLG